MASLLTGWVQTLDSRIIRYEPELDPISTTFIGPAIFLFWHEYLLVPCAMRQGSPLVLLTSKHRDADWLVGLGDAFGYENVRGSTARGGSAAVLKILKQLHGKSLVITPDGPLGPRREVASGCIFLASLLGIPLVPLGCGYDRPWRIDGAWDKFALPRFGSRTRFVMAEAIRVPKKLGKEGVEEYRLLTEQRLLEATVIAEDWAASGIPKPDEQPMFPARIRSVVL